MSAKIIQANIFNATEQYIAHQCNCITNKAAHLAKDVFTHFPYADVYSNRISEDTPGTICVRGNGVNERYIIAMFAQFYPGRVRYPDSKKDGFLARENYFLNCLRKISKIPDIKSIAFPYRIGCGAAGGNWENYEKMINLLSDKTNINVSIYRNE